MRSIENVIGEQTAPFEAALVHRAQNGDEAAFREIVARYQNKLFRTISGIARSASAAEEIAQRVFVKFYPLLPKFDLRSSLAAWLCSAAVDESFDYLKNRENIDDNKTSQDRLAMLLRLLVALPKEERRLLVLRDVEGFSLEELARTMNAAEDLIAARLLRARERLIETARRAGVFQQLSRSQENPAAMPSKP